MPLIISLEVVTKYTHHTFVNVQMEIGFLCSRHPLCNSPLQEVMGFHGYRQSCSLLDAQH